MGWFKSGSKVVQKSIFELVQKWFKSGSKVYFELVQKWFKSGSKVYFELVQNPGSKYPPLKGGGYILIQRLSPNPP
jgi:hypothetical protein